MLRRLRPFSLWIRVGLIVRDVFLLFDGDVVKLCGIKYFSALLALDILGVFVARDDFYDWVFAGGGHGWGGLNGWILPGISELVNHTFRLFSMVSGWFVDGAKLGKAGCMSVLTDVDYLGLEVSVF